MRSKRTALPFIGQSRHGPLKLSERYRLVYFLRSRQAKSRVDWACRGKTVWQRVKRGDIEAIHVRHGRKKGSHLRLKRSQPDLFNRASLTWVQYKA